MSAQNLAAAMSVLGSSKGLGSMSIRVRTLVAAAAVTAAGVVFVPSAAAAFGDDYAVAPINSGPGTVDVPALPDVDGQGNPVYRNFFWAGTCDRSAVVGLEPGTPLPGGVGVMPSSVSAISKPPTTVAPPSTLMHCIDWQLGPGDNPDPVELWPTPPQWRLGAATTAGSHVDGSTTMAFDTPAGKGYSDNIVVRLPAGFMANPNAVPKCSADQFAEIPRQCPPQSQVGVLSLRLEGDGLVSNGGSVDAYNSPVFNLEPRKGNVAELGLVDLTSFSAATTRIVAKARTNDDFGVAAFVGQIPNSLPVHAQAITLWGVPWAAHNDVWRAPLSGGPSSCREQPGVPASVYNSIPASGLSPACQEHYDPSWGEVRPFVSLETDCNQAPVTTMLTDAYQFPGPFTSEGYPDLGQPTSGNWKVYQSPSPAVAGCESLPFGPDIEFQPTDGAGGLQRAVGRPAGLKVDLALPQNNSPKNPDGSALELSDPDYLQKATAYFDSPQGRATAHLKDTVVTLPAGVSVNPSGAAGLAGCSDAQIGIRGRDGDRYLFNDGDPFNKDGGADGAECPDESKVGTATVDTPLLDDPLTGEVILGTPNSTDPRSGEMLRLFVVVRDPDRGLVAKIFGSSTADGTTGSGGTGRLTATFRENPEVPFDNLQIEFKNGPRSMLAMPQSCGDTGWIAALTPWSSVGAPVEVPAADDRGFFYVDSGCGQQFTPGLQAGTDNRQGGGSGTFSFKFSRTDGEQWFHSLTAELPKGFLAAVRDVTLCTNAQADAAACPASSKVGIADAKAGAGDPFVLEEKGEVFLTEGYKGGPYGLAVKIRGIAGPFRGDRELSPIVVRQKIDVDPSTAQVSVISDALPQVHHGVPLRVREVNVIVNRAGFTRNPTSCAAKQIKGNFTAADGAGYERRSHFQASNCSKLGFKPRLTMRLTGRSQLKTGKHPGVRAQVTQEVGEAGISRAIVRLPLSLALDPDNAQALCEFEDGTKPDLENHCPKGSIVGRASAVSPLLKRPLAGDVYFVKNVRRDPDTGNAIRTLPMIIVALRGEISINLKGESSTTRAGKLVNTFRAVPDAPVTRFNLNINGGKNGILAVTRTRRSRIDLCKTRRYRVAEADFDAHNNRVRDLSPRVKTPCKPARSMKKMKKK
jgi:hypothetical protein